MPKVYIINKSGHDFSAAERFGELIFLSEGKMGKYSTASMYREFAPILDKSSPKDYIVTTALTTMSCIAVGIFVVKHKKVNLLLRKDDDYVVRTIKFDELIEEGKSYDS